MSTKKKPVKKKTSNTKNILNKAQQAVREDIVKSLAITSILLNIFFLTGIIVLSSTNIFNRGLYNYAQENYCKNIDAVVDRAEELGSEKAAIDEWQISCAGKDFKPFLEEAVDKYRALENQK